MSTNKEALGKGPAPVHDGDAALQYVNVGETIEMTPKDEKRLLRKIDLRIVPLMCMYSHTRSCLAANYI